MIAKISGKIIHKDPGFLIIETAGIGFKVYVSNETISDIAVFDQNSVSLWTHLAIREDSWDIYGFSKEEDLGFFQLLISISGIGPKTALAVLNASSAKNLKTAIASGDTDYLTKISGIGKKLAEKIVFELKDKMGASDKEAGLAIKGDSDVLKALVSLGYGEREAREAIKKLSKDTQGTSDRVKNALKILN